MGLWGLARGEAPMFRVGAIPCGIPLRTCMELWGPICGRIGPGALGRARLNVKHRKCRDQHL